MFVLTGEKDLEPLRPMRFEIEADFQKLLEKYPALLSGELINPEEPRRWVLVAREMPVPGELDGSGIWSADHLFLDQDGIPTIVEVKRQSDTRLRREVVAQMLDYAANASAYWKAETLQTLFEADCRTRGLDPAEELRLRLGDHLGTRDFWERVKTNLEAGKLRLLFVADFIPRELKIIVEFLNRQMNPAEVLALELKQYGGPSGIRTLAPSLFGQTERARSLKNGAGGRQWDEAPFLDLLSAQVSAEAAEIAKKILGWARSQSEWVVTYGRGKENGTISTSLRSNGIKLTPMQIYTNGKLYFTLTDCKKPPFDNDQKRMELLNRLNAVSGTSFSKESINKQPSILLDTLIAEDRLEKLFDVMGWLAAEVAANYSASGGTVEATA